MKLAGCAGSVGVHPQTASRWVREDRVPVPFRRLASGHDLRPVLSDRCATVIVVEHRDRLARFGVGHGEAALAARGRRIVVAEAGESTEDVVGDMIEVWSSMCARLYGRRGAGNPAMRAVTATQRPDPIEARG